MLSCVLRYWGEDKFGPSRGVKGRGMTTITVYRPVLAIMRGSRPAYYLRISTL